MLALYVSLSINVSMKEINDPHFALYLLYCLYSFNPNCRYCNSALEITTQG